MNILTIILFFVYSAVSVGFHASKIDHGHVSAVTVANTENIEDILSQQPLLIEFYAPWCNHCIAFEQGYESIATNLRYDGFAVAKVDVAANPALQARFDVSTIPSFFLHMDNKVWKYEGPVTVDAIITFVKEGHKGQSPMPFWTSPMGVLGILKGKLTLYGMKMMKVLPYISKKLGIPEWAGFAVLSFGFGMLIMLATVVAVCLSVAHSKQD